MDDLPLVREKVSDKIPKHIKTLQTVQNTQKETVEKVEAVEEQVLQQDKSCGGRVAMTLTLSAYLSRKEGVRQRQQSFQTPVVIDQTQRTLQPLPAFIFTGKRMLY